MTITIPQYSATAVTTTDATVNNTSPLHFDLNTNPDPVRVSPSGGDLRPTDFVLVGSRRSSTAIHCRKITLTVPTGNNSPDLTPDITSAAAHISLPGWTPVTNANAKTITFTPASGHAEIGPDQGVTLQLMGMLINTVVGSAPLRVDLEWREAGFENDPWVTGTVIFDIGKFPPDFHLANFIADPLIIDNSGSVLLKWEANGVSSLRLLYDVAEINVLNQTNFRINNLTQTTVFYLRATVQVGTNTVERTLSTTVTVRIPDLEVSNLLVLGEITMMKPYNVTVSGYPDIDPLFPVKNMFDGNLDTYFKSKRKAIRQLPVTFDLRDEQEIDSIDIYFGDQSGEYLPPPATVGYSAYPVNWFDFATYDGGREFHFSFNPARRVRYFRLVFREESDGPIAIRSFQIAPLPAPMKITRAAAEFGVPVTTYRGINEH
jgi:F5/8 type C domain-containing protein